MHSNEVADMNYNVGNGRQHFVWHSIAGYIHVSHNTVLLRTACKTKLCMKYFTKIPLLLPIRAEHIFPILSMVFFLNSCNSITVVLIDIKLGI